MLMLKWVDVYRDECLVSDASISQYEIDLMEIRRRAREEEKEPEVKEDSSA